VWNRGQIVVERDSRDNVTERYIRSVDGQLIWNYNRHWWYLFDARGSVTQRVNNTGQVLHSYQFSAFGVEVNPDTNNGNRFRFNGMYYDIHRSEYMTPNRIYSPRRGRWNSPDPLFHALHGNLQDGASGITQAGNLYMFVMHNPIRWIDPTGLSASSPHTNRTSCTDSGTLPTHLPSGWGALNDFLYLLEWIFGSVTRSYTDRGSVIIQAGSGNFMATGEFFLDGRVGANVDGRLFMYHTDFFQTMGIGFEQRLSYVNSRGIARHITSFTVGLGTAYVTGGLGLGVLSSTAIGSLTVLGADGLIANIFPEPGNYMFTITDAFVWNPQRERYQVMRTEERLVWGNIDARGSQGWVAPPRGPHISHVILW